MGITPQFSSIDVAAKIKSKVDLIDKAIIRRLQYLGEQCVTKARQNGSYRDVTGNLRSSIGYIVSRDGVIVSSKFSGQKKEGAYNGMMVGQDIVAKFSNGYCLVVVAGMSYAIYVEAKGRDVLSSTEHWAQSEANRMISQLKVKIS